MDTVICANESGLEVLALVFSGIALVGSMFSIVHSDKANRIAAMSAWAATLMSYVEDELKSLARDAETFQQICTVPFANPERKQQINLALNACRDESRKRMHNLSLLSSGVDSLLALRDERDSISDSYFDNSELMLPKAKGEVLLKLYDAATRAYTGALRDYLFRISRAALEPPKRSE